MVKIIRQFLDRLIVGVAFASMGVAFVGARTGMTHRQIADFINGNAARLLFAVIVGVFLIWSFEAVTSGD